MLLKMFLCKYRVEHPTVGTMHAWIWYGHWVLISFPNQRCTSCVTIQGVYMTTTEAQAICGTIPHEAAGGI